MVVFKNAVVRTPEGDGRGEAGRCAYIFRRGILGRGNSGCKGSESGPVLEFWGKSRKTLWLENTVNGAELAEETYLMR